LIRSARVAEDPTIAFSQTPVFPLRYTDQSFPPYAFVPGEAPHPTRDPLGHSYSEEEEGPVPSVTPAEWHSSPDYLFGVDLYNAGYLWEAHEAWEGLWHVSKHDPVQADFIQGLIQCAAACLKIRMGQARGMQKLMEQGTGRLLGVIRAQGPQYMGLELASFISDLQDFVCAEPSSIEGRPRIELS
jgi:hypothetical protein